LLPFGSIGGVGIALLYGCGEQRIRLEGMVLLKTFLRRVGVSEDGAGKWMKGGDA
jgi:hypothetical protein